MTFFFLYAILHFLDAKKFERDCHLRFEPIETFHPTFLLAHKLTLERQKKRLLTYLCWQKIRVYNTITLPLSPLYAKLDMSVTRESKNEDIQDVLQWDHLSICNYVFMQPKSQFHSTLSAQLTGLVRIPVRTLTLAIF